MMTALKRPFISERKKRSGDVKKNTATVQAECNGNSFSWTDFKAIRLKDMVSEAQSKSIKISLKIVEHKHEDDDEDFFFLPLKIKNSSFEFRVSSLGFYSNNTGPV